MIVVHIKAAPRGDRQRRQRFAAGIRPQLQCPAGDRYVAVRRESPSGPNDQGRAADSRSARIRIRSVQGHNVTSAGRNRKPAADRSTDSDIAGRRVQMCVLLQYKPDVNSLATRAVIDHIPAQADRISAENKCSRGGIELNSAEHCIRRHVIGICQPCCAAESQGHRRRRRGSAPIPAGRPVAIRATAIPNRDSDRIVHQARVVNKQRARTVIWIVEERHPLHGLRSNWRCSGDARLQPGAEGICIDQWVRRYKSAQIRPRTTRAREENHPNIISHRRVIEWVAGIVVKPRGGCITVARRDVDELVNAGVGAGESLANLRTAVWRDARGVIGRVGGYPVVPAQPRTGRGHRHVTGGSIRCPRGGIGFKTGIKQEILRFRRRGQNRAQNSRRASRKGRMPTIMTIVPHDSAPPRRDQKFRN